MSEHDAPAAPVLPPAPAAAGLPPARAVKPYVPLIAWSTFVVPLAAVLVYCCANAPVVFDVWTPYFWRRTGTTFWHFAVENYRWNNPRLGHILTVPVSLAPWNAIVMPVIDLAVLYLAASLALGRFASLRRADDAFVALVLTGLFVACSPAVGPMLFYAPYTGNYVLGFALALAFLMPYRLALASGVARRMWLAPLVFVVGVAAGWCNEHTAPAVGLLALAATIAAARETSATADRGSPTWGRPAAWMLTGLVGFALGAAALYFAPGQHVRYGGLATKVSTSQLLATRGISGFLRIALTVARHASWCVPFAAVAMFARVRGRKLDTRDHKLDARGDKLDARGDTLDAGGARLHDNRGALMRSSWRVPVALIVAALVVVATLLASPKLGDRLLFAPTIFVCIAIAALVAHHVRTRPLRLVAGVLAAALLVHAGWRWVAAYRVLGPESRARLAALEAAAKDGIVTLPAFTVARSRYSAFDDLGSEERRKILAWHFGLAEVRLTGNASSAAEGP